MNFMTGLFLLLAFWIQPVAANTPFSKLLGGQTLLGKNPETSPEALPPSPANLTADWWRYFEVEPAILQNRIDNLDRQLENLLRDLTENIKPDAASRKERIVNNLRSLLELRKKAGPAPPAFRSLQEKYTLGQWLDIVRKRRTQQVELQSEKEDLLRDEKRVNAARQSYDSLMAAYLQSSGNTGQGLDVMTARTELAVDEERLRLQKAAYLLKAAQLEQLVKESAVAQDRLFVNEEDKKRLEKELAVFTRELETARAKIALLEASTTTEDMESDAGKVRAMLIDQRVRHAAIKEGVADAVLTRRKMELEVVRMLSASDQTLLEGLKKHLQESLRHIADIDAKLDSWRQEVERDQWRAGKSLAALFGTTGQQNPELIDLIQQRLTEAQNTLLSLQRLDDEIHDARLIADRLRILITERESALQRGLENVKTTTIKAWELLWERLETSLFKIGETPVTTIGILRVLLIVTLAWIFSYFVRRGLTHLSERQSGSSAFLYTLGRLTHYLILIIGISIGLSSIGVDLSNFALIAGALSLGIGFGLQAIVSNFVSGLIVLFERSLRIGDFVELSSGVAGEVRSINVRSTLVTTPDMVDILVPNSEFVNGKVINWTLTDASRRIHIPFGVAYGSDKELVRKAALEAAGQIPHTVKNRSGREPDVWLTNFGSSSLDFELVVWVEPHAVKRPGRVRAAYYWELETALKKYGIVIPFPQRDLHIRSGLPASPIFIEKDNHPTETEQ